MSIDVPELADLEQVRGRWRTAVAGVLSKSTRKDPEQLGDEPERLLETPTYDGIAIRALYTALDELPEPPLPGEWPYVRGGDALRDVNAGWKVAEAFPVPGRAPNSQRRQRGGAGRTRRRGQRAADPGGASPGWRPGSSSRCSRACTWTWCR